LAPNGREVAEEISRRRRQLSPRKKTKAKYSRHSSYWRRLIRKERAADLGCQRLPPHLRNIEARRRFWSVPGRGIYKAIWDARHQEFLREAAAAGIVHVDSDSDEEGSGDDEEESSGIDDE